MRSIAVCNRARCQLQLQRSIPFGVARLWVATPLQRRGRFFSDSPSFRSDENSNASAEEDAAAADKATVAAMEKLRSSIDNLNSQMPSRTAKRAAEVDKLELKGGNYDDISSELSALYNESRQKYNDVWQAYDSFKRLYLDLSKFEIGVDPQVGTRVEDLTMEQMGQRVTVYGYIKTVRLHHKNLAFAELSDGGKTLQLIHCSSKFPEIYESLKSLAFQSPVRARGILKSKKLQQPAAEGNMFPYEKVELQLEDFEVYNSPSVYIMPDSNFPPKQRHLQIRTEPKLLENLKLRARTASICRNFLESRDFLEVETPLLFKSTPEGAREFLVVTRNKGHMYALPQSPQQYKQILMASGVNKYYQLAKCFRDEDLRADRQPEFTQLDIEMAFADGEAVMYETENLVKQLLWNTIGVMMPKIPRMTYHWAISKYGSDKPDLRFGYKIKQITNIIMPSEEYDYELIWIPNLGLSRSEFKKVYEDTFGGDIIPHPYTTDPKSPDIILAQQTGFGDKLDEHFLKRLIPDIDEVRARVTAQANGKIAAYLNEEAVPDFTYREMKWWRWAKKTNDDILTKLADMMKLQTGFIVALSKRKKEFTPGGGTRMGELRKRLHAALVKHRHLPEPKGFKMAWITDFPLFTPEEDDGKLVSTHHPFTAPLPDSAGLLRTDPSRALAHHYDLVCNGVEIGGGSTRIHDPETQRYVLTEVLKLPPERLKTFDHLIEVLESGAPPHAGIALGFDRLVSLIAGVDSIRDVIAFPKNSKGADPVVESPGPVGEGLLGEYGLKYTRDDDGEEEGPMIKIL